MSSPGAERQLILPGDLSRFQSLPLRVEYKSPEDGADIIQVIAHELGHYNFKLLNRFSIQIQVMELLTYDEASGTTEWRLAEVKANAPMKGRKMSKKQKDLRFNIPVASLVRIRIHVDF